MTRASASVAIGGMSIERAMSWNAPMSATRSEAQSFASLSVSEAATGVPKVMPSSRIINDQTQRPDSQTQAHPDQRQRQRDHITGGGICPKARRQEADQRHQQP